MDISEKDVISVIIPVYKTEEYLPRCLDSVIGNTYGNLEIICVNDGSPDDSSAILKEYAAKDKRIIVIDQTNQKLSAARNTGMEAATGKWITFIDSDDWIHRQFFEVLVRIAEESGSDVVIGGAKKTVNMNEVDIPVQDPGCQIYSCPDIRSLRLPYKTVWGRLIRRDLLKDIRFLSGAEPMEDNVFNILLFHKGIRTAVTETKLYYYYTRAGSAIHSAGFGKNLLSATAVIADYIRECPKECREEMTIQCLKVILSGRLNTTLTGEFSSCRANYDLALQRVRPYLPELPDKQRIFYTLLLRFPFLYGAMRILDDPTLLKMRKNHRQK